ncbi:unnamed protein product [Caenorhabditis sp. 36 PRJEB53466]|nr:unnamed protein product [Caenorhabditis sp. 36 PRJEB53466]
MQHDFHLNIPYRQQAVTRNHRNYQGIPQTRVPHGCHVFCLECLARVFLGSPAFQLYLLVAWCIGLWGLMSLQKPHPTKEEEKEDFLLVALFSIYLLSQVSGLLAVIFKAQMLFVPYAVILAVVTIANIIVFCNSSYVQIAGLLRLADAPKLIFETKYVPVLIVSCAFLVYNLLCFASMTHVGMNFETKRILAEQRRRDIIAHNARIYERLVRLSTSEQPVTAINVDSPPKYSSLKPATDDTPPPGYTHCMVSTESEEGGANEQDEKEGIEGEGKKGTFRRALFQDPSPV